MHKTGTSGWKLWLRKQRQYERFTATFFQVVWVFHKFLYNIVSYARHFQPVKILVALQINFHPATAKRNIDRWIKCVISRSTGTNGVRLAHHISYKEHGDLSFLLLFSKHCLPESIHGKFQKRELTHSSKRVGHVVPGAVVWPCLTGWCIT